MARIIKKIIAIVLYLFVMYITFNLFVPENDIMKKSADYLVKQDNITEYEELMQPPLVEPEDMGFHLSNQKITDTGRIKFSCQECHSNYPHKENIATRAFYNMHSIKMACLTCHLNKNGKGGIKIGWFDAKGNFKKGGSKLDNVMISYYVVKDQFESVLEKEITDHKDLKSKFGVKVKLNKGLMCKSCHSTKKKPIISYKSLGYSKERIDILRNLDEAKMFDRKKTWFYLDL